MEFYYSTVSALSSAGLAVAGLAGVYAWRRQPRASDRRFWLLAGLGMLYLALDEWFNLHEVYAAWIEDGAGIHANGPVNHLDDLFLAAFALAGLIVLVRYMRTLLAQRAVCALLAGGAVILLGAIGIDGFAPIEGKAPVIEEALELAGTVLLAAAFLERARAGLVSQLPSRIAAVLNLECKRDRTAERPASPAGRAR